MMVVDADGHFLESFPVLRGYVERLSGASGFRHLLKVMQATPLGSMGEADRGEPRGTWWGISSRTLDLATVLAPRLLHSRLDELGLDFVILYPTLGLDLPTIPDPEIRALACRAFNTMVAELQAGLGDRLAFAALVPMHEPREAIAELEHAVGLGLRVAMIPPGVARPWAAWREAFPAMHRVDRFGMDSDHDYDPVWRTFERLGLAVTSHGATGQLYLDGGRRSPSSFVFNHLGVHAYQQCELLKSLLLGGVMHRFPHLPFAFLEGGAGWATDLYHDLLEHRAKRCAEGLREYDPSALDVTELKRLMRQYGPEGGAPEGSSAPPPIAPTPPWVRDEFAASGLDSDAAVTEVFRRQVFIGCEAGDRSLLRARDARGNAFGLKLNAFFSSDIGHWDVPDITRVVSDSRRFVTQGLLDEADWSDFVYGSPTRLHTALNPAFFDGTPVSASATHTAVTAARHGPEPTGNP